MSSRASSGPAPAGVRSSDQVGAGGLLGGFLPALGGAFMLFVIVYTFSQGLLTGVEIAFGFGLAAIGLILSFVSKRVGKSPSYTDPTTSYGDRVEEELAGVVG